MRRIVILLSLCLFGTPAFSATIIMHGGSGRDCYLETLQDNATPERNRQSLVICNQAVADAAADIDAPYNYAAALINRANVKLRLQDYAGVVTDSERAIRLDSSLGPAHLNRGAGLVGLKRFPDAMASLNQAIVLNSNRLEMAYFDRAIAKESTGDLVGAYHDYQMAVQINPNFQRAADELSRFKVTNS